MDYYKVIALLFLMLPQASYGFISDLWSYLSRYQLGLEYVVSQDIIELQYGQVDDGLDIDSCQPDINREEREICKVALTGGHSSGIGLFIQQPFRRTGSFLLNLDMAFGARYLAGEAKSDDLHTDLALEQASFSLVSFQFRPYLQLGYTPMGSFPDIIISFGPVIQAAVGEVAINEVKENVALVGRSGFAGFFELEIVFLRFGDGAFSIYSSRDSSGKDSTPFYPGEVDTMSEFKASFKREIGGPAFSYGLKLVLSWP